MIDIGVNLCGNAFNNDREAVITRALTAGIQQMVVTGTEPESIECAATLVQSYPQQLFFTAGFHPHHASVWSDSSAEWLKCQLQHPQCVAVGETGLDFYRNFSTPKQQTKAFAKQLELAVELQCPVFLHQRDAQESFVEILDHYRAQLSAVVVHCFTDNRTALEQLLERDCHIGITGWICDPKRGKHLHELISLIPANRLMIETDAPYLFPAGAPVPLIKRRNEPHYLCWIAAYIADLLHLPLEQFVRQTTTTSREFFNLPAVTNS